MPNETEEKAIVEVEEESGESHLDWLPSGIISFADFDVMEEAKKQAIQVKNDASIFKGIIDNILEIEPSEDMDKSQMIMDVAQEFSQRVDRPVEKESKPNVIQNAWNKTKELFTPKSEPEKRQFEIWLDKEVNQYRWLAIYSNNFRDNDSPPEIISEASHRSFVKGVETGVYPYPELWLWHVPGSRIGQADWLSYTDEGFAVASGYFDKGKEHIAKRLSEQPDTLVSHGMPKAFVKRDPQDKSVIIQHITKEISPLPSQAAANKLTGFELLSKEETMIPEHKAEYLKAVGFTDEELKALNDNIRQKAETAKENQLESKEETKVDTQETPANEKQESTEQLTLEGIAGLLQAGLTPIAEQINALDTRVKELEKSDTEKIVKQAQSIPNASLEALLAKNIGGLFSNESQVDGRTSIAKSGPQQAEVPQGVFFEPWMMEGVQ